MHGLQVGELFMSLLKMANKFAMREIGWLKYLFSTIIGVKFAGIFKLNVCNDYY